MVSISTAKIILIAPQCEFASKNTKIKLNKKSFDDFAINMFVKCTGIL